MLDRLVFHTHRLILPSARYAPADPRILDRLHPIVRVPAQMICISRAGQTVTYPFGSYLRRPIMDCRATA
jgi:hypothetical protein